MCNRPVFLSGLNFKRGKYGRRRIKEKGKRAVVYLLVSQRAAQPKKMGKNPYFLVSLLLVPYFYSFLVVYGMPESQVIVVVNSEFAFQDLI